jgi:hypothetical protein
MRDTDYRNALRVLHTTLALIRKYQASQPAALRRRVRHLSLRIDLLRARLRQPSTSLERN